VIKEQIMNTEETYKFFKSYHSAIKTALRMDDKELNDKVIEKIEEDNNCDYNILRDEKR